MKIILYFCRIFVLLYRQLYFLQSSYIKNGYSPILADIWSLVVLTWTPSVFCTGYNFKSYQNFYFSKVLLSWQLFSTSNCQLFFFRFFFLTVHKVFKCYISIDFIFFVASLMFYFVNCIGHNRLNNDKLWRWQCLKVYVYFIE